MKKLNFVILFFVINFTFGKNLIKVEGEFKGYENVQYVTISLSNIMNNQIIYTSYLNKGKVSFTINSNLNNGIYRMFYSDFYQKGSFDIIIENENLISFTINIMDKNPLPTFKISTKNQKWYTYKKHQLDIINNINTLTQSAVNFKTTLKYNKFKECLNKIELLKNEFAKNKEVFISNNTFSIVELYEKNFHSLFSNANLSAIENLNFIKKIFFNNVSYNENLLNTPIYRDILLNYLYLCHKIDKNQFYQNINNHLDNIPTHLKQNHEIKEIISSLLISEFNFNNNQLN